MKANNKVTSCQNNHARLKMFTTDSFECRDCGRIFEVQKLMDHLVHLQSVVDNQANDEGLWVIARYASEAYIQKGIRTLHHEIEEFEL